VILVTKEGKVYNGNVVDNHWKNIIWTTIR